MVDDCLQPNGNISFSSSISNKPSPTPSLKSKGLNKQKIPPALPNSSSPETEYFEADFHRLADAYPGHADLDHSLRVWMSLIDSGDLTAEQIPTVFAGLDRWVASEEWAQQDGKFIPRLSNWINGEKGRRWLDKPKQCAESAEQPDWHPPWEDGQGNVLPEFADDRPFSAEEIAATEKKIMGGAA